VTDAALAGRRGILVPALVALAMLGVLLSLGTWQVERKAWKEGLIATLGERIAEAATDLPARAAWNRLDPAAYEFRRVTLRAQFLPDQEALAYTAGSALRSDISGPGYWVFAPARLADGTVVVVNRGFVPEGRQDPRTRAEGQVSGPIEIVGAMRWPEARGLFTPADNPTNNLWFVRDHVAMAAAKGWGAVAPFFIDQEQPQPPGGLPRPGRITPNLTNNHLQYAFTWYGLALVLLVAFIVWARSRRSERPAEAERQQGT
jgi:surfeit locus 1 family protein